jgi:transcriptional regulator with XRE-family HTH domain
VSSVPALWLALRDGVCDHFYPGTREGFILVSKAPPKTAGPARANGEGSVANGDGEPRRAELADFLRTRREAIRPEDVGLPANGRRRTPGLRREEVAQLAGVGTTWYTWLEQARDVRASASVLEAIAGALQLTPAERAHLILLGRGEQAAPVKGPREKVHPTVRKLIEGLDPNPACIIGRRYDFLAWNEAHSAVFGDPSEMPDGRRNLVWSIFTDPARRSLHTDWAKGSRRLVARFRAQAARHVGDPDFEDLISALQDASAEFREWWDLHEVASSGVGRKNLEHPEVGELVFEHAVFHPEDDPELRCILYAAVPDAGTPEKLQRLLRMSPR